MSMQDVKLVPADILYRFVQVIIRLQVGVPGHPTIDEGCIEKRNQPGCCSGVARGQQRHIVPLCDLFFNEMGNDCLCPAIVLRRNSEPWRSNMSYLHILSSF